jgi:serine/threonine-protein kinase
MDPTLCQNCGLPSGTKLSVEAMKPPANIPDLASITRCNTISLKQFTELVIDSNLTASNDSAVLLNNLASSSWTLEDCVKYLLNSGLTVWQLNNISSGKVKGFSIGSYVLTDELHSNQLGNTYLSRHVYLARKSVLKIVPAAISKHESIILPTIRARASLEHAGLAKVLDSGSAPPVKFIAMEFIDGCNLAQMSRYLTLNRQSILSLMLQLLSAVRYAHHHRFNFFNLSPTNIIIGIDGIVRITSLGAFVRVGDLQFLPKSKFSAPELLSGHGDERSDAFSLGMIFRQLITEVDGHESRRSDALMCEKLTEPDPMRRCDCDTAFNWLCEELNQ